MNGSLSHKNIKRRVKIAFKFTGILSKKRQYRIFNKIKQGLT